MPAAPFVITSSRVMLGQVDLTNVTAKVEMNGEVEIKPANNCGAGGYRETLPGLAKFDTKLAGNASFDTGGVGQTFGTTGTQQLLSIAPLGDTVGNAAIFTRGRLQMAHLADGAVGDVAQFALDVQSDTAECHGFVAIPLASQGAVTGTQMSMGAISATQKLYAGLHVTGAVGTNLVVTIESAATGDSGFASPTTRGTFSTTSAVGWQWLTPVAGAITDTRWRAKSAVSTSTFTFFVVMGIL